LQAYEPTRTAPYYRPEPLDAYAQIILPGGKTYRHEFYYGSTYLSQSARLLQYPANAERVRVVDYQGKGRLLGPTSQLAKSNELRKSKQP
jgi:hypothetical protein